MNHYDAALTNAIQALSYAKDKAKNDMSRRRIDRALHEIGHAREKTA